MIWPTFCIDNFFKNSDAIINFSKTLKFNKSNGSFPGKRTEPLQMLNKDFFDNTTRKIMACLYPNELPNLIFTANQYFQKINSNEHPYGGFIHQDLSTTEFTSIIYLSESNSNTCIYRRIKETVPFHDLIRNKAYKNEIKQKDNIFQKELIKNNKCFEKTIEFRSIKNRMILFDGSSDHGVENFGKKNETRLTLITFFKSALKNDGSALKFHSSECMRY